MGYNLPDNVRDSDSDAPWNQEDRETIDIVVCFNRDCSNWEWESSVGHERSRELDRTNCRIHDGYELLDGDCSGFEEKGE